MVGWVVVVVEVDVVVLDVVVLGAVVVGVVVVGVVVVVGSGAAVVVVVSSGRVVVVTSATVVGGLEVGAVLVGAARVVGAVVTFGGEVGAGSAGTTNDVGEAIADRVVVVDVGSPTVLSRDADRACRSGGDEATMAAATAAPMATTTPESNPILRSRPAPAGMGGGGRTTVGSVTGATRSVGDEGGTSSWAGRSRAYPAAASRKENLGASSPGGPAPAVTSS